MHGLLLLIFLLEVFKLIMLIVSQKQDLKEESDSVVAFNSAKHDRTLSGGLGLSATRPIGEEYHLLINLSHTKSEQHQETDDDYQSYGFTFALDTSIGNQNLSPFFMLSKSDYETDADAFSKMWGFGGFLQLVKETLLVMAILIQTQKAIIILQILQLTETNAVGHGFTFGHDFILTEIISSSLSLGYSDTDAHVDAGNDYETYDFGFGLNFAFPWAYIAVGNAFSFNDYKKEDTTVSSNKLRSDYTSTFDLMLTKAIGDIFPRLDPNRSLFINLSYEKLISEANMLNYDYISDSFSLSFSKSFKVE